jgi:hypothetical protein
MTIIAAGVGAYLSTYRHEKGKNLATKVLRTAAAIRSGAFVPASAGDNIISGRRTPVSQGRVDTGMGFRCGLI